jgi:hypothetical protein
MRAEGGGGGVRYHIADYAEKNKENAYLAEFGKCFFCEVSLSSRKLKEGVIINMLIAAALFQILEFN